MMFYYISSAPGDITFRQGVIMRLKELRSHLQRTYFPHPGKYAGEE
jgi:hypothetical protein